MRSHEESIGASDSATAVSEAVARVRGGEREAFAVIVKAYERRLRSLCLALLRDPVAAEELTQEAFVRAYRYLGAYLPDRPFYPWLAKIAVRLVQRHRSRRQGLEAPLGDQGERPATGDHPLSQLIREERGRELWEAVLHLPERERAAVVLFYRQDLTVRETAEALGVAPGTVKTLLHRARRHLRERLAGDQGRKP